MFCFRERVPAPKDEGNSQDDPEKLTVAAVASTVHSPEGNPVGLDNPNGLVLNGPKIGARSLLKSASISGSKCVEVKDKGDIEVKLQTTCSPNLIFSICLILLITEFRPVLFLFLKQLFYCYG